MKRKFAWQWLICFLFIAIGCLLPTDTVKAEIDYRYVFQEKEQAYYIEHIWGVEKDEELELPTSYNGYPVVGIKKGALTYNDNVKKVTIPHGYTTIEEWAFSQCDNLEEVIIHGEIKKLNQYTFRDCDKLKTVVLPDTLKTIDDWAFYDCGIQKITLPKSVKKIGDCAFRSCENLYQLVVKGDRITFGDWVFYEASTNQLTIVAKKGSDAYEYAETNGHWASESTKFKVKLNGKKMFVGEKKKLITYNNPYKVTWKSSNKKVVAIDKEGTITAKKTGKATITAKINGKSYKYKITVVKRNEKNVLNIVWSNYVTKDMTDYEKILAANKWLAQNVTYDKKNYYNGSIPMISHTAEGALAKGVAVCDGYAYAYQKIIDHYGIENKIVYGSANNGTGSGYVGHAWNLVKIGTRWYHVDVTWNDPVGDLGWDYVRDDYLLLSNAKMDDDHKWVKKDYPTASKKAPDTNITTVNKNGLKISTIEKELKVGKKATLKVTGTKKKVTWSSSNSKIVKVDKKGKITAKKKGTATIYFKVDGKKYAVKVTVTK